MTERQRTGRPAAQEDANDEPEGANNDEVRELADTLMANAQDALRRLGMGNANEFLNATRQSGGQ